MEFTFYDDRPQELLFEPTADENRVIREAIRNQLFKLATQPESHVANHLALSWIYYFDITTDTPEVPIKVQCAEQHLASFCMALEAEMLDFPLEDLPTVKQIVDDMGQAAIEIEARRVGLVIPEYVPDNVF